MARFVIVLRVLSLLSVLRCAGCSDNSGGGSGDATWSSAARVSASASVKSRRVQLSADGAISVAAADDGLEAEAVFETVVSPVLDELERRTLLRFRRNIRGGILVRTRSHESGTVVGRPNKREVELCCFNFGSPHSSASTSTRLQRYGSSSEQLGLTVLRREFAVALLKVLGVSTALSSFSGGVAANNGKLVVLLSETEALDRLYASAILPKADMLPAKIEIGVWMLASKMDGHGNVVIDPDRTWENMIVGRGRRVIAGAMQWAMLASSQGMLPGLVGALPTFVFRGNKAEVVLLGAESAQIVMGIAPSSSSGGSTSSGGSGPWGWNWGGSDAASSSSVGALVDDSSAVSSEGLGPGIRRATLYARGLATSRHGSGDGFAGGVPTFVGSSGGSLLLLRLAFTEVALYTPRPVENEEHLHDIEREHHSAQLLASVSRWAQARGALMGLPSFVAADGAPGATTATLEVLLVFAHDGLPTLRPSVERAAEGRVAEEAAGFLHFLWSAAVFVVVCAVVYVALSFLIAQWRQGFCASRLRVSGVTSFKSSNQNWPKHGCGCDTESKFERFRASASTCAAERELARIVDSL